VKRAAIAGLEPSAYQPHALHREPRVWNEGNCYVDLWIELLSALGLEPRAALTRMLAVDFEGDQWTFCKPTPDALFRLYGIDVQELQLYDCFARHVAEQLARRRVVIAEVDSFHLPDTSGTAYRAAHVKTTIGLERFDPDSRRLGYFHNGGYHLLEGEDFDALMAADLLLPPFVEIAKLERVARRGEQDLRACCRELVANDLERRPERNPILSYGESFEEHASWLRGRDLEAFHAYAFATLRQAGAAFELAAACLRWLAPDDANLSACAADFEAIALAGKTSMLRLARAVHARKSADIAPLLELAPAWDRAFERLLGSALARGKVC
jgi:hypothetical protein